MPTFEFNEAPLGYFVTFRPLAPGFMGTNAGPWTGNTIAMELLEFQQTSGGTDTTSAG